MDVNCAMLDRRSVRAYEPREIPEESLNEVLEAARIAPSAANRQLWKFVVIKDEKRKRAIAKAAKEQGFILDDYWLSDKLPPYYTYEHSLKQLDKWVFKVMNCNKSFFVRFMHLIFKKFPFTVHHI